jgi:predicted  nucleic acid-binding Zn ribbon protein
MKQPPKFRASPKTMKLDFSERCPKCGKPWSWGKPQVDSDFSLRCPHCDALFGNGRFVCYGTPRD